MKKTVWLVLCFFTSPFVKANPEVVTIGSNPLYKIDQYYSVQNTKNLPFLVPKDPSYWHSLTILNNQSKSNYVFEFIDFRIDDIELYVETEEGLYQKYKTGDFYPFESRPILHKNLVFQLPCIYNKSFNLYFKTTQHSQSDFVIQSNIRTFSNFVSYGFGEYSFLAFFYGILFCMGTYNFTRFLFTQDSIHLIYVFYVIALSLFSLSRIDGLGFEYLWPNYPWFNQYSFQISLSLFVLFSIYFASSYLEIKKRNSALYKYILIWIAIRILLTIMNIIIWPEIDLKLLDMLVMYSLAFLNIRNLQSQNLSTLFFLIAYGSMLLGFLIYTLQDYSLISNSILSYYGLNIGVFAETLLLSLAISEKTRILMKEKQKAQEEAIRQLENNKKLQNQLVIELQEKEIIKDRVNLELEEKVEERTKELYKKNELLNEQNTKIELLASEIDKQYYYLKKDNAITQLNFLWTKHISFEKFSESFPDDFACIIYLEKLKWNKDDFCCVKCEYTNFTKNPNNLNRKCNRCTHIESVTANTLFHGLRFPIQKAFYLTHCCVHGMDGININALSTSIDLRLNTCLSFISKVKDKISNLPESRLKEERTFEKILMI